MEVIKVYLKSFNPPLLSEEILAHPSLGAHTIAYHGFVPVTRYQYDPAPETVVYGRIEDRTGVTELTAEPGEMHFEFRDDPGTALDDVLTAHDHTGKSDPEQEEDAKADDTAIVTAALRSVDPFTDDDIRAVARLALQA